MAKQGIGLAELIKQVKMELFISPQSDDSAPLLSVEEIELDISVTVSKDARAGINIQVVELGGSGQRSDVQLVHVKLVPLLTREERLEALRSREDWDEIVQGQLTATIKGIDEPIPGTDSYQV
jgi:hypothetical protein